LAYAETEVNFRSRPIEAIPILTIDVNMPEADRLAVAHGCWIRPRNPWILSSLEAGTGSGLAVWGRSTDGARVVAALRFRRQCCLGNEGASAAIAHIPWGSLARTFTKARGHHTDAKAIDPRS
jgi:hypothetical protein